MPRKREQCEARKALSAWMAENGVTKAKLAKTLGVAAPSVGPWFENGRPKTFLREAIEEATGGAVKVAMWEFPSERLAKLQTRKRVAAGDAA